MSHPVSSLSRLSLALALFAGGAPVAHGDQSPSFLLLPELQDAIVSSDGASEHFRLQGTLGAGTAQPLRSPSYQLRAGISSSPPETSQPDADQTHAESLRFDPSAAPGPVNGTQRPVPAMARNAAAATHHAPPGSGDPRFRASTTALPEATRTNPAPSSLQPAAVPSRGADVAARPGVAPARAEARSALTAQLAPMSWLTLLVVLAMIVADSTADRIGALAGRRLRPRGSAQRRV